LSGSSSNVLISFVNYYVFFILLLLLLLLLLVSNIILFSIVSYALKRFVVKHIVLVVVYTYIFFFLVVSLPVIRSCTFIYFFFLYFLHFFFFNLFDNSYPCLIGVFLFEGCLAYLLAFIITFIYFRESISNNSFLILFNRTLVCLAF